MPENNSSLPPVPESKVVSKKRTRLSVVWLIPIAAALAGVWVAVTRIMSEGPTITIVFPSAEGLEANKTKIRYSGLDVGTLSDLRLADDHHSVIATAKMEPKAKEFLVKDTRFWVVQPRVSGLNITGLSTLISGDYIGVDIGKSKEKEEHFVALSAPPMLSANAAGRFFMLKATQLGSLDRGTPIYFRQIQAGEVVSYELDKSGHGLDVKLFVKAPYDQYVSSNTRFWQASGIDMSLTASGLHIQTESVMSILAGGIAFETPATEPPKPPAAENATFTLFSDRVTAFQPAPRSPHEYRLSFSNSVRGLVVGAPVQVNGITIGEVTEVHAQFDEKTLAFTVPVLVRLDPERYGVKFLHMPEGAGDNPLEHKKAMDELVARGLRAQLRSGSMLTGALYVALDFFPDAPPASVDWSQGIAEVPTVPGEIQAIEARLAGVVKKIDQLDFKKIGDDLQKTIGDADKALVAVHGTLGDADKTLVALHGTLGSADKMMANADKVMSSADKLIDPNSEIVVQLSGMLHEAGGAARALRTLADYLERQPEALIQGKTGKAK